MARRDRAIGLGSHAEGLLGARLRSERQASGASLSEMARRLGYSKGHLSQIETGGARPSPELVEAYTRELGVSLDDVASFEYSSARPQGWREVGFTHNDHDSDHGAWGVGQLIESARRGVGHAANPTQSSSLASSSTMPQPTASHAVILGSEAVLRRATDLMQEAAESMPPAGEEILLTIQPALEFTHATSRMLEEWQTAMRTALDSEWDIAQICKLNAEPVKSLSLVTEMLGLLGFTGRYRPYSLQKSIDLAGPLPALVVPGKGAMLFLTTHQFASFDVAYFFPPGEHLEVLRDHIELIRSQSNPILTIYTFDKLAYYESDRYPPADLLRFDFAYTQVETQTGDRFLVKDGLSTLTLPFALYQEWSRRIIQAIGEEWSEWARTLVENRMRRVSALHSQIESWHFRDICSKRAIERLVATGEYPDDDWFRIPLPHNAAKTNASGPWDVPATPAERVKHLQAVIDRLKKYPNYELSLLDDSIADEVAETYWWVKGKEGAGTVFLRTWRQDEDRRIELRLEIIDPIIVEAFREYFMTLWARLPTANRDKSQVIAWLQEQIGRVQ